ncbi:MAG TPA: DUF4347 domain-containing protein, partial [Gammaproteobacteria bacterium]|nr:DUF4347 domain-containing protein [Gammaproteobacteria bacterium]
MIRDWQRRFRKRRLAQACGSGRQPERLLFEPLEPRLLLSADLPLLPAALVSQPEEVQQLSAEELERLQHPEAPEAPPQADAPAADGAVQAPPASTDAAAGDVSVAPAGPADWPPLQGPDLATLAALQPGLHLVILDPGVEDAGPLVASLAQALGAPAPLSDGAPAQEGEAPARDHAAAAPATPPSAAEAPDARSAGNSREVRRTPEPAADEGDRVEVVRLDPGRDGVVQIEEILSGYTDLASVHLISHGAAGLLRLGNAQLDRERLAREQERVARWGQALRSGGDVLLYGCDVAEGDKGRAFVDAFARTLGRDVAASVDDTGNPALGGDWDLEYRRGMVETASAQALDYAGLLETLAANVIYADGPTEGNFTASRRLDRVVAEIDLSSDSGDLTLRFGKGGTLMVEKGSLKLEMRLAADARVVAGQGDNTVLFGRGAAFDGVLEFPNGTQSAAIGFSSDLNDPNGLLVRGETRPVKLQPIGSSGRDFRVVAGANDFEIRNLYTVQKIVGGRGADSLVGSDLATYRDVLAGGRGDDRIQGQAGNDQLLGGQGKDQLEGGSGADDLQGEGGDDLLQGDEGDDLLSGGDGDDLLSGGLGNDTLQGGDGADELIGDYGDDTLSGGDGDDNYYFLDDWGLDTLIENAGEGRDTVDLSGVTTDLTVDISADIRVS